MAPDRIKILFLTANPDGTGPLRLDREVKAIDRALRESEYRDRFELIQHWAVSVDDLQGLLLRHQPHIVHFSGHGSRQGAIVLEATAGRGGFNGDLDVGGQVERRGPPGHVSARALSQTFKTLKDNVRCVVLNACYTESQARGIAEHIDVVCGMSRAISDDAAVRFASALYLGLGYGRDLRTAFDLGCNSIDLEGLKEQDTPRLLALRIDPQKLFLQPPNVDRNAPRLGSRARPKSGEPIQVFYSYAHEDEDLRKKLETHLALLRRQGVIEAWHDRDITAGIEWEGAISEHLERADLILLLVSADFLASDYVYDVELTRAMERHGAGEARVIPILLREVDWRNAPFARLQALPKDAKPVTSAAWHSTDEAFTDVARGIRRAVEEMARA